MNWQHFKTILWLRWRMSINQLRRGGIASAIILGLLGVFLVLGSIIMFLVALVAGIAGFSNAKPDVLPQAVMYVWDGVLGAFLFFWLIGLMTELQRSEVLSLQKLLHLPVSLSGTFFINYLGSLFGFSTAVFLPAMIALCIALVVAKGVVMLPTFLLLGSFLLMVTALTYQFQGWLAALMTNPRRRRTVIATVTLVVVLVSQAPNLISQFFIHRRPLDATAAMQQNFELNQLDQRLNNGEIDAETHQKKRAELLAEYQRRIDAASREKTARIEDIVARVNMILPIGWMPYGAMACARGNLLPAFLGTLGAGAIGAGSLWRSYRTVLRLYTGQFTSGKARPAPIVAPAPAVIKAVAPAESSDDSFLERRVPGISDHAAAIALASFRSLTRAPEAKMLLLSPAIMVLVFGSMLLTRQVEFPNWSRPLIGFGAIAMINLTLMQLIGNQFGLDRQGFRTFVLSAAPRRDILLGKNLSLAPLAGTIATVMVAIAQAVVPMRISHFFATLVELGSLFMILCVIGNFTSILAPMPVASGSLKPANPKLIPILLHLVFMFLFPIVFSIALAPLGLEMLLHHLGWLRPVPIYLIGAALELAAMIFLYRAIVAWQGDLLQAREQKILAVVTTKVE